MYEVRLNGHHLTYSIDRLGESLFGAPLWISEGRA